MRRAVPHRGMYVVFSAGDLPFAIPATSVLEVVDRTSLAERAPALAETSEDLAALFGLPADDALANVVLIIDMNPVRLLKVRQVYEVADLSDAPFFALPARIRLAVQGTVRGARFHKGRLLLELAPEALATLVAPQRFGIPVPEVPPPLASPPEAVLVFRAGSFRLGAALTEVGQVVAQPAICAVPLLPECLWGILHSEGTLHVVADVAGVLGSPTKRPAPMAVLVDVAGVPLAVPASEVEGIRTGLRMRDDRVRGAWVAEDDRGPVHLPRYGELFAGM